MDDLKPLHERPEHMVVCRAMMPIYTEIAKASRTRTIRVIPREHAPPPEGLKCWQPDSSGDAKKALSYFQLKEFWCHDSELPQPIQTRRRRGGGRCRRRPDPTPAAGEDAGPTGGGGAKEYKDEDKDEDVVGKRAEEVLTGATGAQRIRDLAAPLGRAYTRVDAPARGGCASPSPLVFLVAFFSVRQVCFQYFPRMFIQYGRNSLEFLEIVFKKSRNSLE
jgi:hypothetical protein